MKKFLLLLFFLSSFCYGQRADFFQEDITFHLNKSQFDVEGYYWFTNNSDKPIISNLFYPFPNYSGEKIDSIRLFNISGGENLHYNIEGNHGISFNVYIVPKDTILLQIGYRQEIKSDSASYILKSTKAWGKPLVKAEYKLIVPDFFKVKKFSYTPDKSYEIQNQKIYYWKKKNFMPEKDMIFYFK